MHRPGALSLAILATVLGLTAAPASACSFHRGERFEDGLPATPVAALPSGIVKGWMACPGRAARPLLVWSLEAAGDGTEGYLGVRDAPLFRSLPANPLVEVARVGFGEDGAFALFMRADRAGRPAPAGEAEDTRRPFRVFGTLCDGGAGDALDCSIGPARVKMRVDTRDLDGDGTLDLAHHELSLYDGERIQVLRFVRPHDPRAIDMVRRWIEVLRLAGYG